jgi:hemerythrin-like domain-containing protein
MVTKGKGTKMTIKAFMSHDHKRCDEMLAEVENAVEMGNFDAASAMQEELVYATLKHFDMEERYLFPMFDENNPMAGGCGPTHVMRMEHDQARTVFPKMREALEHKDSDRFFGLSESLMILLQQHNAKEEQMLYTMIQNMFATQNDAIVEHLQSYTFEQ